jgi:hypothetical protein
MECSQTPSRTGGKWNFMEFSKQDAVLRQITALV